MNLHARSLTVLTLLSGLMRTAHAAGGTVFAAPTPAAALPGATGGLLRVLLALVLVVAAIAATAWMTRRMRALGGSSSGITVVAQVSLGARERAVLLRVADREVLVGVAPGNVRALCLLGPQGPDGVDRIPVLEAGGFASTASAGDTAGGVHAGFGSGGQRPSFKALLLRSLGK